MTELIETLLFMLDQPIVRNNAIKCLTEIAGLKIDDSDPNMSKHQQSKVF